MLPCLALRTGLASLSSQTSLLFLLQVYIFYNLANLIFCLYWCTFLEDLDICVNLAAYRLIIIQSAEKRSLNVLGLDIPDLQHCTQVGPVNTMDKQGECC